MDALPEALVPVELAARYPRIANRLARLWEQVQPCRAYFDDLRIDWRLGRQGFPGGIQQELDALFGYYQRKCAAEAEKAGKLKRDVWENEPDRVRSTVMATTMLSPWHETTRLGR